MCGGCPDKKDGYGVGTCHNSHSWYEKKWKNSDTIAFRCQYSLTKVTGAVDNSNNIAAENPNINGPDAYNIAMLDKHNYYRSLHQDTPLLVYDQKLADEAYEWSRHLHKENQFKADVNRDHGENLARSTWPHRADDYAVIQWYEKEIEKYNYN